MTQQLEDVLSELRTKERELVLSARYGKALLEEKEQLRNELQTAREEMKQLEENLQSQRHDSQRAVIQAKTRADEQMTDLEYRLRSTNNSLETERNKQKTMKDEYQKTLDTLQSENAKLKEKITTLLGDKNKDDERVRKVSDALKQSEAHELNTSLQREELQQQMETLEFANRSCSQDVSTLAHTCDQLTEELQSTRAQYESLERRYIQLNEEFVCQCKELEDSQEIVKQLEADRQRTTAVSPTSTMSLHDELSYSMNSLDMIPEATSPRQSKQSSPQPVPTSADLMVHIEPEMDFYCSPTSTLRRPSLRSLQSGLSTLRRVDHQELMATWSTSSDDDGDSPCPRCKNMHEMVTNYQQELSFVNKQLLSAVEQKIKLQEQNEAWQSDMAEIVHQNLYQRLEQDSPARKEKLSKSPKRKMITSNKDDAEKIFKHEFIKHSWLF